MRTVQQRLFRTCNSDFGPISTSDHPLHVQHQTRHTTSAPRLFSDRDNLVAYVKSLAKSKSLHDARFAHAYIVFCGHDHDMLIANFLMQMYGSNRAVLDAEALFSTVPCPNLYSWNIMISVYSVNGLITNAWELFSRMPSRDVVSWNAMIAASVNYGRHQEALSLFYHMHSDGVAHNAITFISILDACADNGDPERSYEIHASIIRLGFDENLIIGNALIKCYGRHGDGNGAWSVFCHMQNHDVVSWTGIISSFAQSGDGKKALNTFYLMQQKGWKTDKITCISVLDACACLSASEDGRLIHSLIIESVPEFDIVVSTALVNMYGECNRLADAKYVFSKMPLRNIISWTAMLAAFSRNGYGIEALQIFYQMQMEHVNPNNVTLAFAVDACTRVLSMVEAREIHAVIVKRGLENDTAISTSLINLYGTCRCLSEARAVFDKIHERNIISWSNMIMVCTYNGSPRDALDLFHQMQFRGAEANSITYLSLMDACSSLASLHNGRVIDRLIIECRLGADIMLGNSLISMYGRCGSCRDAEEVFSRLAGRTVVSWTALIAGFAQSGYGTDALSCLNEMLSEGIHPDSITFTSVLSACSHSGLVENGKWALCVMMADLGVPQGMDHFFCMVDILARAGQLDEAEVFLSKIPFQNLTIPQLSLLGACKNHGDVKKGLYAATFCVEQDPQNSSAYTMLGNIFATDLMFDDEVMFQILFDKISYQDVNEIYF